MLAAKFQLGPIDAAVESAVGDMVRLDAVPRLWRRDHTLFQDDPSDCANRMGWLEVVGASEVAWGDLVTDSEGIAADCDHVVLMGMGGSSLFPEVLAATFPPAAGRPRLHVIDTTDPAAVRRVGQLCPPERTFHVAASKSGSTVETRSHLAYFWERSRDPSRFGVITDPGSALGAEARAAGYRHVWENDPDIGGRYSALSLFGMVPAALIGLDGPTLLGSASEMADSLGPLGDDADLNLGLRLGAAIGAAALAGRDKLTLLIDTRLASFGAWLEQLVAESLGKLGVGSVPVVGEPTDLALGGGQDRLFVIIGEVAGAGEVHRAGQPVISMPVEELTDIGAHVFLWEFAVAVAGRVMGVNPFDQPDVEAAKAAARRLLEAQAPADPRTDSLGAALSVVEAGDYLALCAFVDPGSPVVHRLSEVRFDLGRRLGVATTLGLGPRFLHSTGQLHKGGGHNGVFVQVVGEDPEDLEVPGQGFTFGELKRAQAAGDLEALRAAGQRAFRVPLEELLGGT